MNRRQNNQNAERPQFLPSFIGAIQKESELRGWRALFPYVLSFCAVLAAAVAYYMPASFWSEPKLELAVAVYVGILTFNGLILALGWSAFSRMYDVLLRGEFGKYLMNNNLLNDYILAITFMHIFQVGAIIVTAVGLVALLLEHVPSLVTRIIFGGSLALTAYAIKQATDSVSAMNDLVWQAAFFEANRAPAGGNVVSVRERG